MNLFRALRPRPGALAALTLLALLAMNFSPLYAQGKAALSGVVLDASGKSLPNARVTVRTEAGKVARTTKSDDDGKFSISDLTEGTYSVDAVAPGFSSLTKSGIRLTSAVNESISLTLS